MSNISGRKLRRYLQTDTSKKGRKKTTIMEKKKRAEVTKNQTQSKNLNQEK